MTDGEAGDRRRQRGPGACQTCGKALPKSGSSWYATHCREHTSPSSRFRAGDGRASAAGRIAGARVREAFDALKKSEANRLTDDGKIDR